LFRLPRFHIIFIETFSAISNIIAIFFGAPDSPIVRFAASALPGCRCACLPMPRYAMPVILLLLSAQPASVAAYFSLRRHQPIDLSPAALFAPRSALTPASRPPTRF
jgi:hypothetical protein